MAMVPTITFEQTGFDRYSKQYDSFEEGQVFIVRVSDQKNEFYVFYGYVEAWVSQDERVFIRTTSGALLGYELANLLIWLAPGCYAPFIKKRKLLTSRSTK